MSLGPKPLRGQSSVPQGDPTSTFQQLSAQAASSREAGRADEAIRFYRGALQLQPDWAEGWWYLGTLNYDGDHYSEAIPAFQRLVASNPEMGPALAFLGLSEFEIKDYKNARRHLERAQHLGYGDDAELAKVAAYHLALILNWSGEFEKTVEWIRAEIGRSRPPDEIKFALGMALLRIPLTPGEVDPGKDALVQAAGEASVLMVNHESAAAAQAFSRLLAQYPKTPYLHYAYATALADAGKYEDAFREFSEEAKVSPRSAVPDARIASLQLQLHHAKQALPSARRAVLLAPHSSEAHEVLARTLKDLGETQSATKEFTIAKKLASSPAEVDLKQRQLYARLPATKKAPLQTATVAMDSEPGFDTLAQKAAAAQTTGQMDAALSYYQRALALRPDWEEGWRNLGTLYYASARYVEAISALKNSLAINDHNGNVWALLGLSEFETRDYQNSLIHLEQGRNLGLAGNPAAIQVAKYHLAILLNRAGDFDRASELLASGTGVAAQEEQVKFAMGMALLRIPRLPDEVDHASDGVIKLAGETAALLSVSKYDLAFANFQRLLQMDSRMPYLHYAYGSALASASRYGEAEEQLLAETEITPGSALPFLRRSSIALVQRHTESAAQLAQRAVQLAPESAEAHYLLGRSWLELGKVANSMTELETARRLAPNSPEVHFTLARAYAKAGQPASAETERAAFERLNTLLQKQRSQTGSQAYGEIQNQNGMHTPEP